MRIITKKYFLFLLLFKDTVYIEMEEIKNIRNMTKDQLVETIFLIEMINKKKIFESIKEFEKKKELYTNLEIDLIENKIETILFKKKKYIQSEKKENITIYEYENEIKIFHKTEINKEKIIELIKDKEKIKIKEGKKFKNIKLKDIFSLNKDFEIIINK